MQPPRSTQPWRVPAVQLLRNARLRGETGWVVAHKAAEFGVLLVGLKLFTNLMSPAGFGEYQLGLTTLTLAGNLFEVPISQVYLRQYHTALAQGTARAALVRTLKWLGVTSLIVAGGCALLTRPLADAFKLETFTILAVGLAFLANRWRSLRVQVLDIQRERRKCLVENIGFYACQTVLGAAALLIFQPSATAALLAFAAAAAIFSGVGARGFAREMRTVPDRAPAGLGRLVFTYGVPLGLLMTCQWLQASAERYALGAWFDYATVGRYVAAYQVCGFPFLALSAVITALIQPIAFQRALDISDPGQLWSAHKLLLGSLGLYFAAGALLVGGYAWFGPLLLRWLASEKYALPAGVLTMLAAGRMLMFSGLLQHMFFKVHQQTRFLLLYSVTGAVVSLAAVWLLVGSYGIWGAAVAVLITALVYNLLLTFAPGGSWLLVRGVRRDLVLAEPEPPVAARAPEALL